MVQERLRRDPRIDPELLRQVAENPPDVVLAPHDGTVRVWGRGGPGPSKAYVLEVTSGGAWNLKAGDKILASGQVDPIEGDWHNLSLSFQDDVIQAFLDRKSLAEVHDSSINNGLAGLGTGWNTALFDNLQIGPAAQIR